jgi:membrane protease YdiL (CAAX protease family)
MTTKNTTKQVPFKKTSTKPLTKKLQDFYLQKKSSKKKISKKKINKHKISQSVFFLISLNSIYILALCCMVLYRDTFITSETYVIVLFLFTLLLVIIGIFLLPYRVKHYGLNLNKWNFNLIYGILLGTIGSIIAFSIRLYLIQNGRSEFNYAFPPEWDLLYYPISVFSQETMTKGYLQNYFVNIFEKSKLNELIAIVLSSLIFSALHLMYGFLIMFFSLVFSVGLGFFYSKTKSILGVCITHFMIGTTFFYFKA